MNLQRHVADAVEIIDEHARSTMPEGAYLEFANKMKIIHDKALEYSVYYAQAIVSEGDIPPIITLLSADSDEIKALAAKELVYNFLSDESDGSEAAEIVSAGGIPPLIAMLSGGSNDVVKLAADALGTLMLNGENAVTIVSAGGIPPLIALLSSSYENRVKRYAVKALGTLALNDESTMPSSVSTIL